MSKSTPIQALQAKHGVHLLSCETPLTMEPEAVFGLLTAQAVVGTNFVRDFFAKVADVTGGRVGGYEKAIGEATERALDSLALQARQLGANAVVRVALNTFTMGDSLIVVACSGTAMSLREV